jgi:hypothetical protein
MQNLDGQDGIVMEREHDPNGNPFSRARARVNAELTGVSA